MSDILPQHIAIIMDGNGRWAKAKGLPRTEGHKKGAKNLERVLKALEKRDIHYLTLYAFSTENWKRPKEEVDTLMRLFEEYLAHDIADLHKKDVRIHFIGRKDRFSESLRKKMCELEEKTEKNKTFHLVLALDYGSRDEILRAVSKVSTDIKDGKLSSSDLTEDVFSSYLDTKDLPEPDLMIRTSGEQRISNFLLWQLAYTEMFFTPVAWPDFSEKELDEALTAFANRNRRFGNIEGAVK